MKGNDYKKQNALTLLASMEALCGLMKRLG